MPSLMPFGNCCGINTLQHFPLNPNKEVINQLESFQVSTPVPNILAVLNVQQHNNYKNILPKYGWRLITRLHNFVHNNILYLWVFETNPDRNPDNPLFNNKFSISNRLDGAVRWADKDTKEPLMHRSWGLPAELRAYERKFDEHGKPIKKEEEPKKEEPKKKEPKPVKAFQEKLKKEGYVGLDLRVVLNTE